MHSNLYEQPDARGAEVVPGAPPISGTDRTGGGASVPGAVNLLAEEWEAVFDATPDLILILNRDGSILRCNRAVAECVRVAKEELAGQFCHPDYANDKAHLSELTPFLDATADGNDHAVGIHHAAWGRYYDVTHVPLTAASGKTWGHVYIAHDVTVMKQMAFKLHQAQKLESIGQLAAGIAHEINTPTQYVGDNIRFLRNSFDALVVLLDAYAALVDAVKGGAEAGPEVERVERAAEDADLEFLREEAPGALEEALEGVARVTEIVQAMKKFSHPGGRELTPVDLNDAIADTIMVARNEWKYVAEVHTDFDPDLPLVSCFPGEVNQAVLNIIINAAHAIRDHPGGGTDGKGVISVRTRRDRQWAEIRIEDTGGGIPREAQPRIFDPFFTTKEVGRGTGQGLAIAYSAIVDKHGGTLTFESEPGAGTVFTIRLPLTPEPDGQT